MSFSEIGVRRFSASSFFDAQSSAINDWWPVLCRCVCSISSQRLVVKMNPPQVSPEVLLMPQITRHFTPGASMSLNSRILENGHRSSKDRNYNLQIHASSKSFITSYLASISKKHQSHVFFLPSSHYSNCHNRFWK